MEDKKRYEVLTDEECDWDFGIYDNLTDLRLVNSSGVALVLNQQVDEIKKLKEENSQLQELITLERKFSNILMTRLSLMCKELKKTPES